MPGWVPKNSFSIQGRHFYLSPLAVQKVTTPLTYCTVTLFWRVSRKRRLTSWMNAAARVIIGTHMFDWGLSRIYCTSELHWLNVPERVTYKLCIMVHSVAYTVRRRSTWSTSTYQSPTSHLGSISDPPVDGSSATPVANIRPTGFLCCWPIGLELIAWQFERWDPSVSRDSFRRLLNTH